MIGFVISQLKKEPRERGRKKAIKDCYQLTFCRMLPTPQWNGIGMSFQDMTAYIIFMLIVY